MSGICDTCKRDECYMQHDGDESCPLYIKGEPSNYKKLFGTPERAAQTLEKLHVDLADWCGVFDDCHNCMFGQVDGKRVTCWEPENFSLVEWLKENS